MVIPFRSQSYLQKISRSFVHNKWELSPETILIIQFIVLIILILVLIYILLQRIKAYRRRSKPSPFIKTDRAEIREILLTSMAERSKFELSFSDQPKFAAICTLIDVKKNSLSLELPLKVTPTSEWIGKKIFLYFSISQEKNKKIFYFFESRILNYFSELNGYYLEIEFPSTMEIKQKRRHFRIEAKNSEFERLMLYLIKPEQEINEIKDLPKPIFVYPPKKEKEKEKGKEGEEDKKAKETTPPIQIVNISAGGIRLKFSNKIKKALSLDMENPPDVLLYLSFLDGKRKKKLLLWCRPRNYFEDFVTRDIEVGMEFIKEASLDPKDKKRLVWRKISSEEGQDDLAKWVFLKNLRLIQKGIK